MNWKTILVTLALSASVGLNIGIVSWLIVNKSNYSAPNYTSAFTQTTGTQGGIDITPPQDVATIDGFRISALFYDDKTTARKGDIICTIVSKDKMADSNPPAVAVSCVNMGQ